VSLSTTLSLGFSPCPNDTLIFFGLAHKHVGVEINWRLHIDDIEALNELAINNGIDIVKMSYHAFGHVASEYVMLTAGGALGHGVGPLIVSREPLDDLAGRSVATPGTLTTAQLLLQLSQPETINMVPLRYDTIISAVSAGVVDAGLIIHESRFTYQKFGLYKHLDLGKWWEEKTGLPIPLGGIAAHRSLDPRLLEKVQQIIRESLEFGRQHRSEADGYIAQHAQEISREVQQRHIDLYVNDFSLDLGLTGKSACRALLELSAQRNLIPKLPDKIFLAD
jgi:1,4-dihydroxy-6-naphthoate synthase